MTLLYDRRMGSALLDFRDWLDRIRFHEISLRVNPQRDLISPVYHYERSPAEILSDVDAASLSTEEKTTVHFLIYGRPLTLEQARAVGLHTALIEVLEKIGIVTCIRRRGKRNYFLNHLSLASHNLNWMAQTKPEGTGKEINYFFIDLPVALQNGHRRRLATAQLHQTSYILLQYLKAAARSGMLKGPIAVDWGCGSGIQAISIAKLCPGVERIIGVDIDPHCLWLFKINAVLNRCDSKCSPVVNDPAGENILTALAGRQINLAVSNPPFNAIPPDYESFASDLGNGGPRGIRLLKKFIEQTVPHLAAGGTFSLYCTLAKLGAGQYVLERDCLTEDFCRKHGISFSPKIMDIPELHLSPELYADRLADLIVKTNAELPKSKETMTGEIISYFKSTGIEHFVSVMLTVTRNA